MTAPRLRRSSRPRRGSEQSGRLQLPLLQSRQPQSAGPSWGGARVPGVPPKPVLLLEPPWEHCAGRSLLACANSARCSSRSAAGAEEACGQPGSLRLRPRPRVWTVWSAEPRLPPASPLLCQRSVPGRRAGLSPPLPKAHRASFHLIRMFRPSD